MVVAVLLVSSLATTVVATSYAFVAARLARGRDLADRHATLALRAFAGWWGLTAANQLAASALYLAASLGYVDFTLQLTYAIVQRLLLVASLFLLLYYLLYAASGRRFHRPLLAAYAALALFELWGIFAQQPAAVLVTRWRVDIAYGAEAPAWFLPVQFAVLILPPVVASVAYLRLAREAHDASRRARILAVSLGLIVWWATAVVAGAQPLFDVDWLQLANRALGIAVALGILLAYDPPPWAQRRWGLVAYGRRA